MQNLPLHNYFSTLGAKVSCPLPEVILVDDNARVSAASRVAKSHLSMEKKSRWDSAGYLPRHTRDPHSSPRDISPLSLLKNHRRPPPPLDGVLPSAPALWRCESKQGLDVSSTEPQSPRSSDIAMRPIVRNKSRKKATPSEPEISATKRHDHNSSEKQNRVRSSSRTPIRCSKLSHSMSPQRHAHKAEKIQTKAVICSKGEDLHQCGYSDFITSCSYESIKSEALLSSPTQMSPTLMRNSLATFRKK